MEPELAISTLTQALATQPKIRALFLSGSHGTSTADEFSDLDFLLVTPQGATDAAARSWLEAVAHVGDAVLVRDRVGAAALINVVLADWLRIDVVILTPDQALQHPQDRVRALFDHDDIFAQMPQQGVRPTPNPQRIAYVIEEFMRVLGLLPVALGRQDYNNGVTGLFHLRNLLIELMIAQTDAGQVGGALHLKSALSFDQRDTLAQMPAPIAQHDALIDVHMAYVRDFFPRARRVAQTHGLSWPAALEDAVWARLRRDLGIRPPAD